MDYWILQEVIETGELTYAIGPFPDESSAQKFVDQAEPIVSVIVEPSRQRVVAREMLPKSGNSAI